MGRSQVPGNVQLARVEYSVLEFSLLEYRFLEYSLLEYSVFKQCVIWDAPPDQIVCFFEHCSNRGGGVKPMFKNFVANLV